MVCVRVCVQVTAAGALAIIAGVLACIMIGLSAGGISSDVNYGVYYYYYLYTDPEGWVSALVTLTKTSTVY